MTKKILWALAACAGFACTSAFAATPKPADVTLTIHADKPGAKIELGA